MVASRDLYAFNIKTNKMAKNYNVNNKAIIVNDTTVNMGFKNRDKIMRINRYNNIGLIATLTYIYEEDKVYMRHDVDFDEKKLDMTFFQIMSMVAECNFEIQLMNSFELLSKSICASNKRNKHSEGLTILSDSKELYNVCCNYILNWQTDLNRFCEEIQKSCPSWGWIAEATKDYLYQRMILMYPYLKGVEEFNVCVSKLKIGEVLECSQIDNLDMITYVAMIVSSCENITEDDKEYFDHLVSVISDMDFEIIQWNFDDLLHAVVAKHQDLTYYSDPKVLYEACWKYAIDVHIDDFTFDDVIGGGCSEWEWVSEVLYCLLSYKLYWVYPYLRNEDAFVEYINNLKNEGADYERE